MLLQLVKSVKLPPFPAKKWFGSSNSQAVTEQRRLAFDAWLSAVVASAECSSDPALLAFLQLDDQLRPKNMATRGAPMEGPADPVGGADAGVGVGGAEGAGQAPAEQRVEEMDADEFADYLLEKTASCVDRCLLLLLELALALCR